MLSDKILAYYRQLDIKQKLPRGVQFMNPYQDDYVFSLCRKFYEKYYHDNRPRTLMFGINPGRFGSGTTGISFTDPLKLENDCGIANTLPKKPELSADFIYRMIRSFGGPEKFFGRYFISAVSPLGFTQNGKNVNYYDDRKLQNSVLGFITQSMTELLQMGFSLQKCYCIGEGKNLDFLTRLNDEKKWFTEIIPLAHPRFIMQYKRKSLDRYIDHYLEALAH